MSDRTMLLSVVLEDNYRTDDLTSLMQAIKQFRGVLDVEANISDTSTFLALTKARFEIKKKLLDVFETK